jgi:hypothetical protein
VFVSAADVDGSRYDKTSLVWVMSGPNQFTSPLKVNEIKKSKSARNQSGSSDPRTSTTTSAPQQKSTSSSKQKPGSGSSSSAPSSSDDWSTANVMSFIGSTVESTATGFAGGMSLFGISAPSSSSSEHKKASPVQKTSNKPSSSSSSSSSSIMERGRSDAKSTEMRSRSKSKKKYQSDSHRKKREGEEEEDNSDDDEDAAPMNIATLHMELHKKERGGKWDMEESAAEAQKDRMATIIDNRVDEEDLMLEGFDFKKKDDDGCQIWRLDKVETVRDERAEKGRFRDRCSYIIFNGSLNWKGSEKKAVLHHWHGNFAPKDQITVAAFKAASFAKALRLHGVDVGRVKRQIQGSEDPEFITLFDNCKDGFR